MFSYFWPVGMIVITNVFYNISTKSTPEKASAFLSLTVTYLVAAAVSAAAFLITGDRTISVKEHFASLNWTSWVLGLSIVGLELGYILAFRAGWKVNITSMTANITLAVVLVFVGHFLFKESISLRQIAGIVVCILGLILISR